MTKVRAPIGSSANGCAVATPEYNGADGVTKATDPRGYSTTFLYDVDRQLTKVTDARGKTRQYGYGLALVQSGQFGVPARRQVGRLDQHRLQMFVSFLREGPWKNFVMAPTRAEELAALRRHTRTGRPLGSESFVEKISTLLGRDLRKQKPGRKLKEG